MSNATTRFLVFVVFVLGIGFAVTATLLLTGNQPAAQYSDATASAEVDVAAIESTVAAYLEAHPEVIVSAFTKAREQQLEQQQEQARATISEKLDQLEDAPGSPSVGNKDADVTIVAFSDYNCGFCKRVVPDLIELLKEDKNIKLVSKDFPILGERSIVNAKAALVVNDLAQDKWFDFHTDMLRNTPKNDAQLHALVEKHGIDLAAFKDALDKPKYQSQIQENLQLGQSIGIRGTPAFVIGGQFIPGAVDLRTFKQKIAEAREKQDNS